MIRSFKTDEDVTHCPICGKFLKHGDSIHPETWFCTHCNKLIAIDETAPEDQKYVDDLYNIFSAEPTTGKEFAEKTSKFDDRIMRKFFVVIRKALRVVGTPDQSIATIFYTKGNRKKAIQKFIGVNFSDVNIVPNRRTFKMLIKNGEILVCPHGRVVII